MYTSNSNNSKMPKKRKPLTQLTLERSMPREKRRKSTSDEPEPSTSFAEASKVKPGAVLRMVLKNFMCHEHLEVSFTKNINYVIGRNGSGKSAILTALVVGLGGRASLTNRGNSIKGFIKTGKTSASVEITLSNSGPLSYHHEIYGNQIIIMRAFTASGSSSYKIKSVVGDVISTSSKEIAKICMCLNIQVDNPICLLNQDTSRNFLSTKDPRQKFILFMRATQLEELRENYRKLVENKKTATRALKEKQASLDELGSHVKELKLKLENQREINRLKMRVSELQVELLWSKVKDSEAQLTEQQQTTNTVQEELARILNHINNDDKVQQASNQTIMSLQAQLHELQNQIEDQNSPQNILVRTLGELKESIVDKNRERKVVQKDIALKNGNCGILEKEIQNITENFSKLEEDKLKRVEEIASTEEKIKNIDSLLQTSKNDQFQMINSLSRIREQEKSLMSEVRQITAQIENHVSRLSSLKGQSNNNLSIYGRDMVSVVEAINASKNKFEQLPRGPLGSYIKLKDKKWAVAVEGFFGAGLLRAFAVDNANDNQVLTKILDNCWRSPGRPMLITTKFFNKVHNVQQNLVQPIDGCTSIYSVLEVSDPVVANCLIDQSAIESMLLIPDNEKAIELMSNERRVPKGCRQGITIKGDKYYPDPNYKFYASRYHNAQYLQVSVQEVIAQIERQVRELTDNKQTVNNQYQSIKKESEEQAQNAKDLEVKVSRLNSALTRLKITYENLKNVAEPDVANVHAMENELAELRQLITQREIVSQKIVEDIAELRRKIDKKEEKLSQVQLVVRGYEERIEGLNKQLNEQINKRQQHEVNKRFETARLKDSQNRVRNAEKELAAKQNVVDKHTREASTVGNRPEELRTVLVIMNDLKEHQRSITVIEADKETAEEVLEKYETCKELFISSSQIMNSMAENINELKKSVEKRHRYYQHTEQYFVTFVQHSFQKVLHFRQFQGSIDIDMKEKKLDLTVIPQQGLQGVTATTNLSGGERSFSTVAFLYALWQCMEFPFYFLDEFDVFMDKLNRAKVMEILLHHAKNHSNLQFIFLTPQDVSFVNDKDVAIHRLENPERNENN